MVLTKVKHPGERTWHYVLSAELKPVCPCPCKTAGRRCKIGDSLCRCGCHKFGKVRTLALCEKLIRKQTKALQLSLMDDLATKPHLSRPPWNKVLGRDPGCLTCMALGAKLTKGEVKWLQDRIING